MEHTALDALPTPTDRRVAVRLTPDALRQVRAGHPWVFDGAIRSLGHDGAIGDLAVVFDDKRRFAAIGLYDPTSPIRVRVLHHGTPRQVDDLFWWDKVTDAMRLRRELIDDPGTTGYRCIHGENDGFPGLVADRYDDTLVVKIYSAAWVPHLRSLVPALITETGVDRVVLRHGRNVDLDVDSLTGDAAGSGGAVMLVGETPDGPVQFLERGLRFEADVQSGQKTGHFLDQRENRVLVGGLSSGAEVLDVFCCTGGFSVHAAAGGARSVLSVDRNRAALDTTVRNMGHNEAHLGVQVCDHDTLEGDAFDVLEDLATRGRTFDVAVVDPPSFASRADQINRAVVAYGRLTQLALRVVRPGGLLVQSSCSSRIDEATFHATIRGAADAAGHRLEEWARTGHAVDHPVGFPEGAYLKTLFAKVDP